MTWFIAHLAFNVALADCRPLASGALIGPMHTGAYVAALCYRPRPTPLRPVVIA